MCEIDENTNPSPSLSTLFDNNFILLNGLINILHLIRNNDEKYDLVEVMLHSAKVTHMIFEQVAKAWQHSRYSLKVLV